MAVVFDSATTNINHIERVHMSGCLLRRVCVLLVVVAVATSSLPVHAAPTIPSDVKDCVKAIVDEGICPGIVIGLLDESGPTFWAYGDMTYDGKPVDRKTIFEIGSISKAYTATLLCQLVKEGKCQLDDPIQEYLPDGVTAPTRGGKSITLRHLASHRSGLPRMPDNFAPADPNDPFVDYTPKRMYDFLQSVELKRDIGSEYEYSNYATGLLGSLLARIDGKDSYEQLLVERLAKPLELSDTRLTLDDKQSKRFADGHANGRKVDHWGFNALAGCGAINSTARDVLRFVYFNLGMKDCELSDAMKMARVPRTDTGVPDLEMALGWHVWNKHDAEIVWHNGGTGGFHSFTGFRLDKKQGVVVLANSTQNTDVIGLHLLEPKYSLPEVRRSIKLTEAEADHYVGWYILNPSQQYHITREGSRIFAKLTGQDAVQIFPRSKTEFFYRIVDAELHFERDGDGPYARVKLHQNGAVQTFERAGADFQPPEPPKEVDVDVATLKQYVGKYELAPGVVFDVQVEGEQLTIQITGQPRFPVYAESKTRFFYKVVEAAVTFQMDDDGKVTGLVLHQNGMDQPAKRLPS